MRKTPLTAAEQKLIRELIHLRQVLMISQTTFANVCNLSRAQLLNRETGIAPWKAEDLNYLPCYLSAVVTQAQATLESLPSADKK